MVRKYFAAVLARKEGSDGLAIVWHRRDRITAANAARFNYFFTKQKGYPL